MIIERNKENDIVQARPLLLGSIRDNVSLVGISSITEILEFKNERALLHCNNQCSQYGQKHRPLHIDNNNINGHLSGAAH